MSVRGQAHLKFCVLAWTLSETHLDPRIPVQEIEEGLPGTAGEGSGKQKKKGEEGKQGFNFSEVPYLG